MSDGIHLCPHPPNAVVYDEREGTEICTLCAKVLSDDGLPPAGGGHFGDRRDGGTTRRAVDDHLLSNSGHAAMVHESVIRGAQRLMQTFRRDVDFPRCSDLEMASLCFYDAALLEGVDFTVREAAAITKVSEGKLFRLIRERSQRRRLRRAVDPANIVERIVFNHPKLSKMKYSIVVEIKRRIADFDPLKMQGRCPRSIAAAGILLCARPRLSVSEVGEACGVHRKSVTAAVHALRPVERGSGAVEGEGGDEEGEGDCTT